MTIQYLIIGLILGLLISLFTILGIVSFFSAYSIVNNQVMNDYVYLKNECLLCPSVTTKVSVGDGAFKCVPNQIISKS